MSRRTRNKYRVIEEWKAKFTINGEAQGTIELSGTEAKYTVTIRASFDGVLKKISGSKEGLCFDTMGFGNGTFEFCCDNTSSDGKVLTRQTASASGKTNQKRRPWLNIFFENKLYDVHFPALYFPLKEITERKYYGREDSSVRAYSLSRKIKRFERFLKSLKPSWCG